MLKYFDKGYNEDLLILSGWGFDPYIFDFERLPFNLIVPQKPLLSKDIFAILSSLKKECFVLGWSYGAHIAYDILCANERLLKGLILVGFSLDFHEESVKETIKKLKRDKTRTLKEFYLFCFKGQEEDYKIFKRAHEKRCLRFWNNYELISALTYLIKHKVDISKLERFPSVLIINGKKDIFLKNSPLKYKILKTVELDSGHLPFLKDKFYEEIYLFKKRY